MSAAHLQQRARAGPTSSGSTPRRRPPPRPRPCRTAAAITAANAAADTANAADAQRRRRSMRIFVGAMGLIGTEPLVRALPRPLDRLLCLHTFVLLEQEAPEDDDAGAGRRQRRPPTPPPQLLLLDFIPERPTHPATAAALLTGGGVSGMARVRVMATGTRPEAVAPVVVRIGEAAAESDARNDARDDSAPMEARLRAAGAAVAASPLRLLANDCRTHTAAVLTAALGRPVTRAEVARLLAEAA